MFASHLLFHVAGAGVGLHEVSHLAVIVFFVTSAALQIGRGLLARFGRLGAPDRLLEFAAWSVYLAVACSLGSAAIHLAVIEDHLRLYALFGVAFALLATFQIVWSLAYLRWRAPWLALVAVAVNLGAAAVWLGSRTVGLPIGPTPGVPEGIGAADLISTALELTLAAVLVLGASRRASGALERLRMPAARVYVAGGYLVGAVALATTIALWSLGGADAS